MLFSSTTVRWKKPLFICVWTARLGRC